MLFAEGIDLTEDQEEDDAHESFLQSATCSLGDSWSLLKG